MNFDLSNKQRIFLEHLLEIQEQGVFNNANQFRITQVLDYGIYDTTFQEQTNRLIKSYKKWKKTGIVPEYYSYI